MHYYLNYNLKRMTFSYRLLQVLRLSPTTIKWPKHPISEAC